MKFTHGLIAILSPALLVSAAQNAQAPASPNSRTSLIRVSREQREAMRKLDRRVLLNVEVTDPSGKPVSGLTEQDFTILDQNSPQSISSFQMVAGNSASGRAHIVLVIDSLNNSFSDVARQQRMADAYLRQNSGHLNYPVSLALLSDKGLHKIDVSADGNLLADQLREQSLRPGRFSFNGGPSGGNQRFLLSVKALTTLAEEERDTSGRAILVWMGQGWPWYSDPGYEAATFQHKKSYFNTLVELSTALRLAQVTIDSVSPAGPNHSTDVAPPKSLHGIRIPAEADAQELSLAALVRLTGGRSLNGESDLVAEIAQCVQEADTYYRIAFDPGPANVPNELRSLNVKLDKAALTPRTFTLYYAQP